MKFMKPRIVPQPVSELGQLLGTEDRGQHPAKVRELVQAAHAQVLTIVIQVDPRTGRTTINSMDSAGGAVTYDAAHKLLDAGRAALVKMQTQAEAAAKSETPEKPA